MSTSGPFLRKSRFNGTHVLVVEDDADLRSLIYLGLLLQGMSGDAAEDGLEGLKYVVERKYDVVISDIRLPGLSGFDLARRICEKDNPPKVILLTAYANPQMIKDGVAAGACRVLSKPIGLKALARVVQEVAGRSPEPHES
jgi:DNA-binding response OmpR family regulator